MIWAGLALWACGVICGAALSGGLLTAWLQQEPRRLGIVVRWIVDYLSKHNDGAYIKMYVALFDTRRASKVMAYVRPEDFAEAIGWYAVKLKPVPLQTHPGMADYDNRESKENPRTGP